MKLEGFYKGNKICEIEGADTKRKERLTKILPIDEWREAGEEAKPQVSRDTSTTKKETPKRKFTKKED